MSLCSPTGYGHSFLLSRLSASMCAAVSQAVAETTGLEVPASGRAVLAYWLLRPRLRGCNRNRRLGRRIRGIWGCLSALARETDDGARLALLKTIVFIRRSPTLDGTTTARDLLSSVWGAGPRP